MDVTVPKGNYDGPTPCWVSLVDRDGKELKPIIRCQCGTLCGIRNHYVHPDGKVTASFYHSADMPGGCGWHVFLMLADWTGSEFPPGAGD